MLFVKTSVISLAMDSYIERMVAMVCNETKKTMTILRKRQEDFSDFEKDMGTTVRNSIRLLSRCGVCF